MHMFGPTRQTFIALDSTRASALPPLLSLSSLFLLTPVHFMFIETVQLVYMGISRDLKREKCVGRIVLKMI